MVRGVLEHAPREVGILEAVSMRPRGGELGMSCVVDKPEGGGVGDSRWDQPRKGIQLARPYKVLETGRDGPLRDNILGFSLVHATPQSTVPAELNNLPSDCLELDTSISHVNWRCLF